MATQSQISDRQDFSAHLTHFLIDQTPTENHVVSTFSIELAISLLLLENKNQPFGLSWHSFLEEQTPLDGIALDIGNTVYHDQTIQVKPNVRAILEKLQNAAIKPVDFQNAHEKAVQIINGDVEEQTKGLITNLVNENMVTPNTASVLLNCIYFKGSWLKPFEKELTAPHPWNGDESKKFSAMKVKSKELGIRRGHDDGIEMVAIPYTRQVKFLAILSRDGKNKPHLKDLKTYLQQMRHPRSTNVELVLPKFKLESSYDLTSVFPAFGIPTTTNELMDVPLQVDAAVHKAKIDVDEEGTVAAAATAIMMSRAMMMPRPEPPFIVDREFLYAIYDMQNKRILFSGNLVKPEFV